MNNFQEVFYEAMTRLRANSRAASTQPSKDDARVMEMINGVLVSKPAAAKNGPEVIDLQEYAKSGKAAASVPSINKVKVIADFLNAKRY